MRLMAIVLLALLTLPLAQAAAHSPGGIPQNILDARGAQFRGRLEAYANHRSAYPFTVRCYEQISTECRASFHKLMAGLASEAAALRYEACDDSSLPDCVRISLANGVCAELLDVFPARRSPAIRSVDLRVSCSPTDPEPPPPVALPPP